MSKAENQNYNKVFVLKNKYIIIAAAVVLTALIILVSVMSRSVEEVSLFYSGVQHGAVVVRGHEPADGLLYGKSVSSVRYSQDKCHAAVLISDDASYTLYYTDGDACIKIASSCTNNYAVSLDGKKVMYADSSGGFYVFDVRTEKSKAIDTQVNKFCISPSGTAAVYTKTEEQADTLYIYSDSASSAVAQNYTPLAVSDDLEYIYVLSSDNSLYVIDKHGNVKSKICSAVSADMFCFSADMQDVVFCDGAYTYISRCGNSRIRLMSYKALPADGSPVQIFCDSGSLASVYESLTDEFYTAQDADGTRTLFFVDKNCERTDIAGNVQSYTLTDGNGLVFLDSEEKLYSYSDGKNSFVCSGVCDMIADSDGKYIYYVDASQNLYVTNNDKSVLLASGVEKIYMTKDDVLLFIMTDNRLYSVHNDNKAELIDENVYGCVCNSSAAFYVKNYSSQTGNFELYASDGDEKFKLVSENISGIV